MIGISVVSCFVVLFVFGRRNERNIKRDWELLLSPKGEALYRDIEGRVNNEMALFELTYNEAFTVRQLGSVEEAKHLLDVGYKVIEKFSPTMLRLLGNMATFSRMVSAVVPVTPLRPKDFKLTQLMSLAYLNGFLHQFLVSSAERFRLKLYILGQSFGLATRFLLESTQRIARDEPEAEREWTQIEAIRSDFQTLTNQSLESLRALLTSLSAERREDLLSKGL
jgi:hypothetical protein